MIVRKRVPMVTFANWTEHNPLPLLHPTTQMEMEQITIYYSSPIVLSAHRLLCSSRGQRLTLSCIEVTTVGSYSKSCSLVYATPGQLFAVYEVMQCRVHCGGWCATTPQNNAYERKQLLSCLAQETCNMNTFTLLNWKYDSEEADRKRWGREGHGMHQTLLRQLFCFFTDG